MKIKLDPWQIDFINTKGDKILCCGRQVGKSVACGKDGGDWARKQKKDGRERNILMMAPTERQAYGLYDKTFRYLLDTCPHLIGKGKDKPTKTKITLTNGVVIWCLPVGLAGLGTRFLTIHRLYADEASRIPEEVWLAVLPALLTTGGDIIMLSTPAGPDGEFADCVKNEKGNYSTFTRFSCSSEKVIRERKICESWTIKQKDKALAYLKRQKSKMSRLEYAQEYEGILVDELKRFFSSDLIKSRMTIKKPKQNITIPILLQGTRSLGSDIARMGGDEFTIIGLNYFRKRLKQIEQIKKVMVRVTQCAREIEHNDYIHNYKKFYIDDGGIGGGVIDILLETKVKRKVVAINNSSRIYNSKKDSSKLLKEHLYNNLLALMEKGLIDLYEDNDLYHSLRSIQCNYINGKMIISGKYSHLTEALVRAAWIVKEKGLNIWIC